MISRTGNALAALLLVAAGCSKHAAQEDDGMPKRAVTVDGSSTVFPLSTAVAEELTKSDGLAAVVHESGTTSGFRKFCKGEIDVAGASRPIEIAEIETCKKSGVEFVELPIGYDGLAVVVNARNTWLDHLTVDELKAMWRPEAQGMVTSWKQVRASFPDRPLHLVGPGPDSGTFDYFTQAIVGTQRASRRDYAPSEDDVVLVQRLVEDDDAIGYFGFAYVAKNDKLRAIPIDDGNASNGNGPVAPSLATVGNGTYQPLSRPLFIYVSIAALQRPEVVRFVSFYLDVTRSLSEEVGYVPLRQRTGQRAKERFKARRKGSMFKGGSMVGVTMERLLEAQTD